MVLDGFEIELAQRRQRAKKKTKIVESVVSFLRASAPLRELFLNLVLTS